MSPENACNVIKACCVLHNYVRDRDGFNREDQESELPVMQQAQQTTGRAYGSVAQYFVSQAGTVSWQGDMV